MLIWILLKRSFSLANTSLCSYCSLAPLQGKLLSSFELSDLLQHSLLLLLHLGVLAIDFGLDEGQLLLEVFVCLL